MPAAEATMVGVKDCGSTMLGRCSGNPMFFDFFEARWEGVGLELFGCQGWIIRSGGRGSK